MPQENDIERFKNYVFITPPVMIDDDLELKLAQTHPCDPQKGYVPMYTFSMVHTHSGVVMGDIDLRVALTEKLKLMGGHIGYEVHEPYRGHRYATRSCRLLLPFARTLGINPVVITCDPANIASLKTIEALDAEFISTKQIEIAPSVFRWTNLYQINLD